MADPQYFNVPKILVREPRLMVPGQQPLGLVIISHDSPFYIALVGNQTCASLKGRVSKLLNVGETRYVSGPGGMAIYDSAYGNQNTTLPECNNRVFLSGVCVLRPVRLGTFTSLSTSTYYPAFASRYFSEQSMDVGVNVDAGGSYSVVVNWRGSSASVGILSTDSPIAVAWTVSGTTGIMLCKDTYNEVSIINWPRYITGDQPQVSSGRYMQTGLHVLGLGLSEKLLPVGMLPSLINDPYQFLIPA